MRVKAECEYEKYYIPQSAMRQKKSGIHNFGDFLGFHPHLHILVSHRYFALFQHRESGKYGAQRNTSRRSTGLYVSLPRFGFLADLRKPVDDNACEQNARNHNEADRLYGQGI